MSFLDKIKSMFAGSSSANDGHDNTHDDDSHHHEPVAPPMPPADPAGMPTSEPQPAEPQAADDEPGEGENKLY